MQFDGRPAPQRETTMIRKSTVITELRDVPYGFTSDEMSAEGQSATFDTGKAGSSTRGEVPDTPGARSDDVYMVEKGSPRSDRDSSWDIAHGDDIV
jgi:hypothetical protein